MKMASTVMPVISLLAIQAQASILFAYADFSSTNGLTLKGTAPQADVVVSSDLQLTLTGVQAAMAYTTSPVTLGTNYTFSLRSNFNYQIRIAPSDPATGLPFSFQPALRF